MVIDFIKSVGLVYVAVYLNPFTSLKKWYTPYEKNELKRISRLNTIILTKFKVQSINYFSHPDISSNKLRGDAISLGAVYVCYVTHYEIL